MKQLSVTLLLLLLSSLCSLSVAQTSAYDPILKPGRKWIGELTWDVKGEKTIKIITYQVEEEEVEIEGKMCHTLSNDDPLGTTRLMYEENGRLYYYEQRECESGFVPIYDISLNVGDTVDLYDYSYISSSYVSTVMDHAYIGSEDQIEVKGVKRRRLGIQYLEYPGKIYELGSWIEGIGSYKIDGLPYFFSLPTMTGVYYPSFRILECYDGDELVFSTDDYEAYAGVLDVKADKTDSSSEVIYNLMKNSLDFSFWNIITNFATH